MKKTLTILTFIILLLPMFQTCAGKKAQIDETVEAIEVDEAVEETKNSLYREEPPYSDFFSIFYGNGCLSGYQLVWSPIDAIVKTITEEKEKNSSDITENHRKNILK